MFRNEKDPFCKLNNSFDMLRTVRVSAAIICFSLISLLFLDFTGTLHIWFGWLAKIQFLPALLALNVGIILSLVLLTLLFGRIYCSVICPLGVFQDIIAWFGKRKKKLPYTYSPARTGLRYGILAVFIIAVCRCRVVCRSIGTL